MSELNAFTVDLNDKPEYQRCFQAPQTAGMKCGRVFLAPGTECGLHSTLAREECLVFLTGAGIARIRGNDLPVAAGKVCYIPPHTEHNILNTGQAPLTYVFTVSPVPEL